MVKSILSLALASLLLLVGGACSAASTVSDDVVARVNGVALTAAELDVRFERSIQGADPQPDAEEAEDLKLQILNEMINNEILFQLAAEDELVATDAEVEVDFNEFKAQYTEEDFQEILDSQQMTTDELREEMRKSLTIEKLINKEITSRISVSQSEIEDFFNKNEESFNLPESFHIAHILITPVVDQGLNNTEADDATTPDEARVKGTRLLRDIQGGRDFATVARESSEDPTTTETGGDLGFQTIDAIAGVDPALADAVLNMRAGETYPRVVETRFGYHILRLVERDAGGQKDLTDPRVEAQIRELIFNRRDLLFKGAFLETARNSAEIENFLARRVLERAGS